MECLDSGRSPIEIDGVIQLLFSIFVIVPLSHFCNIFQGTYGKAESLLWHSFVVMDEN